MNRYPDIDPQDLDPATGRPYRGYSSPSLDDSFHQGEMDVDDEPVRPLERRDTWLAMRDVPAGFDEDDDDQDEEFYSDDPRALQGMGR